MRNINGWTPTKYDIKGDTLLATRNTLFLAPTSRLIAEFVASFYSRAIPQYVKGNLADIGCGTVPLYGFYKAYVDNVVTVDWADTFHKNEFLDIECDLNTPPIPGMESDAFDSVILSDVLEHIYDPKALIGEIHRVLKPEGVLLLNVPFHYWIHESPHDYFRYTRHALKRMLEEAGFVIVEFGCFGGTIEVVADFMGKYVGSRFRGASYLAIWLQTLAGYFGSRPFFRISSVETERDITLGYCLVARKSS